MSPTHRYSTFPIVICLAESFGIGIQSALANTPPVADAGLPRYAAKDPVRLDGGRSYDPDNSRLLSFAWTQVSGPPLVIAGADTATGSLRTELAKVGRTGVGLSSDTLITDGNWHRIALTWDGAKRRLYADGVLAAEDSRAVCRYPPVT